VIGMTDGAARTYIQQQLHLAVGTVTTQQSDAPVGNVISQSLEASGTAVDLVESGGMRLSRTSWIAPRLTPATSSGALA
jgi:hypothetical protein